MVSAVVFDACEIARIVRMHTEDQVRELEVDVWPGRIVLRGYAASYYVKQLAQHNLRQRLPESFALENLIVVGACHSRAFQFVERPATRRTHATRSLVVSSGQRQTELALV
jgi:hypothetical protein